jgi:hypothetical protein
MVVIRSKFAPCDPTTTKSTARAGPSIFSWLLGAMLKSYRRREYTEIARYQHLTGRRLTDSAALDTERRTPPIL